MEMELDLFTSGTSATFHETIFDSVPTPIFVVDKELRVLDFNAAAGEFWSGLVRSEPYVKPGDCLKCVHAAADCGGCGASAACDDCELRRCVRQSLRDNRTFRMLGRMHLLHSGRPVETHFLIRTAPLESAAGSLALLMLEDVTDLVQKVAQASACQAPRVAQASACETS